MTDRRETLLVFGGEGQLGRDLARSREADAMPVKALSRASADISDPDAVERALRQFKPSLVVNAAAYTRVDEAEDDVAAAERDNVLGPAVLARACHAAGVPILHVSTDYVFDGSKAVAYAESDPVAPLGVYGRTKAEGEAAVRNANPRHLILRVSWLYGEFGNNFVKTILRLAGDRDVLRVVDDQSGSPTSTRDLAEAIRRIAPRLAAGEPVWGTYHFAGDGVTTRHGFAAKAVGRFKAIMGRGPQVIPIRTAERPTRAVRPQNSSLDCSKFGAVFGFKGRAWDREAEEIADILVRSNALSR